MSRQESISTEDAIALPSESCREILADSYAIALQEIASGSYRGGSGWFAALARFLWGDKKQANALYCLVPLKESTSYAYVAGRAEPPAWLLVALLRSDDGGRILDWIMQDAEPRWWRLLKRARRAVAIFDRFRKEANDLD